MESMVNIENKFRELVDGLDTGLIIFIDDDFTFMHRDPERIVSELACLCNNDLYLLITRLEEANFLELATLVKDFFENFNQIPKNETHFPSITQAKRIVHYLEKLGQEEVFNIKEMAQGLVSFVGEQIKMYPELHDIFMRYGVGLNDVVNYRELFRLVKGKSIRAYKKKPDAEQVMQDMQEALTASQFCICIVDKLLEDNDGVRFIKEEVLFDQEVNLISIIYTSKPETTEPHKLKDYFVIEVYKSHPEALKQLTEGLALCTFVELFNRLSKIHTQSIDSALNMALSRKDNMTYLASMAHEEGITPYEAISNWFQLATQFELGQALSTKSTVSKYHSLLILTQFLQEEFLGSESGVKLEEEAPIQELNTFEIFDYSVNAQHQPPAPGDVYEMSNGTFTVLVGQDCDLIVRGSQINRKAKHADLLKAEFVATRNLEKVQKEPKSLELNYFRRGEEVPNRYGVLKIKLESTLTSDFIVLDLCTFNQDGKSSLDVKNELDPLLKNVLPLPWRNYYGRLQNQLEKYREIRELCRHNADVIDILQTNDVTAINFEENQQIICYPVRRVCRIKREFRDILLNTYWEFRRRTAVNTIGLVERESVPFLDIQIGFPGQNHMTQDGIEVGAYIRKSNSRKKNLDMNKISLFLEIDLLKEIYPQLVEIQDNIIEIEKRSFTHDKTKIVFKKEVLDNKIESVKITLPYTLQNSGRLLQQEKFVVTDFLDKEQKALVKGKESSLYFVFEGATNIQYSLYKGSKPIPLEVEQLLKGILIPELSVKIKLNVGIIEVSHIGQSALVGT